VNVLFIRDVVRSWQNYGPNATFLVFFSSGTGL
jgi:hypothetical protein